MSNFQDWTTVVLRKNSKDIAKKNAVTVVEKRQSGTSIPKDVDSAQPLVTNDLKQKIIQTRTSLKLKQDQFAKEINELPKNIQLCECGKLTLKEAKQIAIKIERKFKVKLLERT
jgi:ribosome-binding protein aMBF1 (putative translation factor)